MGEPARDDDLWPLDGNAGPHAVPEDPEAWKEDLSKTAKGQTRATYANLCIILRHAYGKRLTYNAMAATPYLDGDLLTDAAIGRTREGLERKHELEFSHDNIQRAMCQVAAERPFHPIQDYLRGLVWDGEERIRRVAEEILHVEPTPLARTMLRKWFISAVARALTPGCKVDTAIVLCGEQGYRKSMFFSILGGDWFSDTGMDITTVKGLMQLASAWVYEWGELDRVTTRRHAGDIKAFISARFDKFVPPYGRGVIEHQRSTVIVGTTNEEAFLGDPTGSRRFWVLKVAQRVDTPLLRTWRDQLWAEAVHLYRRYLEEKARGVEDDQNPYNWWLSEEDDQRREEKASEHQIDDPWERPIASFLESWFGKPRDPKRFAADLLTTRTILASALGLETRQQGQAEQNRVRTVMLRLGYVSSRRRWPVGSKSGRVWLWLTAEQGQVGDADTDALDDFDAN